MQHRYIITLCLFLSLFTLCGPLSSSEPPAPIQQIGAADLSDWTITPATQGQPATTFAYTYPPGSQSWHNIGFRIAHDGTRDWRRYYALQFDTQIPPEQTCELRATLATPKAQYRQEFIHETHAVMKLASALDKSGWQRVTLPIAAFDYNKSQGAFLEFIQSVRLAVTFADNQTPPGEIRLRNIRLIRAPVVALDTPVRGQAVATGATARYEITLSNCTDTPQTVLLAADRYGFEAMSVAIDPVQLQIAPNASAHATVSVCIPEAGIPSGGHETQKIVAFASTAPSTAPLAELKLVTARDVVRPSIQLTAEGWAGVREKVRRYDWARESQDEYIRSADTWRVPEAATPEQRANGPEGHPYVFANGEFTKVSSAAVAWQLTRDKKYAEKVALFLRRLADEKTGYPSTFAGTSMGSPQEGGNFQAIAIAYDAILDAGVLTDADCRAIERTFRMFMETYETDLNSGNMGNWSVATATAGLFCSLAMGDLAAAERYISGPAGFDDYLSKGIMDDGWWWECSTSYNFWVAAELTQCALAMRPWGIDLLHREVPASYSPHTIITPWALTPPYGVSFEKWGPSHRNTRTIKQLWDAVPAITDYRAIAFGMNDGHEEAVGGERIELAYHAFRDPAYLSLIKAPGVKRNLIYGVPDLPATDAKRYLKSGCAENLGYALLRSQTDNRAPREQIAAVFKIGTQGGYHGHFDRAALNTIHRYGRSFWNPESIWYGYAHHMYKFYVQTSLAHNMVVVDQKQQEAVPSVQLLFHSGKMMQAVVHETDARWSDPPYGGLVPDASSAGGAIAILLERMKQNRASFPLVTDRKWGDTGLFTERVLQRRLGIVTDDYIIIADYLKSPVPRTFDNIFQMRGYLGLDTPGSEVKRLRHDAQFDTNPRSSGQFITDCDWYHATAPALARFELDFDNHPDRRHTHSEPGVLKIDIRSLWPLQQEIMIAQAPEVPDASQWVRYELTGDGKPLSSNESGVWILGQMEIDAPVADIKELTLSITADGKTKRNALFLSRARLVTADGKEIPLVKTTSENIARPPAPGQDYAGGPIKIAGERDNAAIPAQPDNPKSPGFLRISLAGQNAVRFKATLGGDYPLGDESPRRKVYSIRIPDTATEARFLTILEPFESIRMIKSATATNAGAICVELADGRVQEIDIQNLDGDGKDISIKMRETKNHVLLRSESTSAQTP